VSDPEPSSATLTYPSTCD